jgi:DeoR/GlpR family transcriptional regulator of sugar metabolism
MLSAARKQRIKELILERKSATVAELVKMFNVTDETIRRDLSCLEKEGVLLRSYGGAFIQTGVENQIDSNIRSTVYVDNKTLIAQNAKRSSTTATWSFSTIPRPLISSPSRSSICA